MTGITTEALEDWLATNATRDGESWAGFGGSLIYRVLASFELHGKAYPSVGHARREAGPLNPDATKADVGAIHYFAKLGDLMERENAAVDFDGGGTRILITTAHGDAAGIGLALTSIEEYTTRTGPWVNGLSYMGWAPNYGEQSYYEHERVKLTLEEEHVALLDSLIAGGYVVARHGEGTIGLPDWNENSVWKRGHPERLYPSTKTTTELVREYTLIDAEKLEMENWQAQRILAFLADLAGQR